MIQTGFGFIAFILFFTAMVLVFTKRFPSKIYKFLPPVIIIYLSIMVMFTAGVWTMTESVVTMRNGFINNLVPAMIFLMCLKCNLKEIIKLGPRLTLTFFGATFGVMLGFIGAFILFRGFFPEGTHLAFSAMSAGWMGGTQNFLAVKGAIGVTDELMTNTLLMGNICYSLLIMILVGVKGYKDRFNKFTKTNYKKIENICESLNTEDITTKKSVDYLDLLVIIGLGLFVSWMSQEIALILPQIGFIDAGIWKILIATFIGIGCALTKLGKLRGLDEISTIILYLILALTASNVNLTALIDAPIYIVAGLFILLIIFATTTLIAKIFKFDLYTSGIAIIANVGGVASAPIIAATYDKSLVSVAVLMSLLGDIAGTFLAFGVLEILKMFI